MSKVVAKVDLKIRDGARIEFAVIHAHDAVSICLVDADDFSVADICMPLALWEAVPGAIQAARKELEVQR